MSPSLYEEQLARKIADKSARVAVIGLGYVGLPLILSFAQAGFKTLGLDVDKAKVDALNAGRGYIAHIAEARVRAAREGGMEAACDFARANEADALIICVPTPLTQYREPDVSFIIDTMNFLLPHLRAGQLISLESTTYPGTTAELLRAPLEARGFTIGEDFFLVYSPEREDPGNQNFDTTTIPKVLGGETPACARMGLALYSQVIGRMVEVSSTRAAEMVKLLENIFRAVNVGLVNELKTVTDSMGLDIFEIIRAAATKPFGFTPFYPGPGIGGHCIPIDPFYLTWKAREFGAHTRFIELAGQINNSMPDWVLNKITLALNDRGLAVKNANILLLGLSYKKNVDDLRESPSLEVMELLLARGANISYSDPHVPRWGQMRSRELTRETLQSADAVILLTDHAAFDHDFIAEHAPLIVDTRGAFAPAANIVRA